MKTVFIFSGILAGVLSGGCTGQQTTTGEQEHEGLGVRVRPASFTARRGSQTFERHSVKLEISYHEGAETTALFGFEAGTEPDEFSVNINALWSDLLKGELTLDDYEPPEESEGGTLIVSGQQVMSSEFKFTLGEPGYVSGTVTGPEQVSFEGRYELICKVPPSEVPEEQFIVIGDAQPLPIADRDFRTERCRELRKTLGLAPY